MKKLYKLLAITTVMALCANTAQGQQYCDESCAYSDCNSASYMSAWIPVGALVVAGVIIACTDGGGHHGGSSSGSGSSGSSSHSHSH